MILAAFEDAEGGGGRGGKTSQRSQRGKGRGAAFGGPSNGASLRSLPLRDLCDVSPGVLRRLRDRVLSKHALR